MAENQTQIECKALPCTSNNRHALCSLKLNPDLIKRYYEAYPVGERATCWKKLCSRVKKSNDEAGIGFSPVSSCKPDLSEYLAESYIDGDDSETEMVNLLEVTFYSSSLQSSSFLCLLLKTIGNLGQFSSWMQGMFSIRNAQRLA